MQFLVFLVNILILYIKYVEFFLNLKIVPSYPQNSTTCLQFKRLYISCGLRFQWWT